MYVLAHLSDPHVPSHLDVRPHALLNKRFLGYLSWRYRRRTIHREDVLLALTADLAIQEPDHVAVTGDIVNIALPHEFKNAARWLQTIGDAEHLTVVPGNHDAYVTIAWSHSLQEWAEFMTSEDGTDEIRTPSSAADFPFYRRRGALAIVGLSTAAPSALGMAIGRLGKRQISAARELLIKAANEGRCRVVMLHHPPTLHEKKHRKRLVDAAGFRQLIADVGAELVIHGHTHRDSIVEIPGRDGPVPVIGVPSASAVPSHAKPGAQYHLYGIAQVPEGWRIEIRVRRWNPATGRFGEAPSVSRLVERQGAPGTATVHEDSLGAPTRANGSDEAACLLDGEPRALRRGVR